MARSPRRIVARSPRQRGGNKTPPGRGRATGIALEKRLDEVESWLTDEYSRSWMYAEAKRRWDIQPRTLDDDIAKVKERWEELNRAGRVAARASQRASLMRLRRLAWKRKSLALAVQVEAGLMKLQGTEHRPGDDLVPADNTELVFDIDLDEPELEETPKPKLLVAATESAA